MRQPNPSFMFIFIIKIKKIIVEDDKLDNKREFDKKIKQVPAKPFHRTDRE